MTFVQRVCWLVPAACVVALGDTPDTQSRLSIHQESNGEMRIEIFSAGDPDPQTIACSREQAMPILSKILWKL